MDRASLFFSTLLVTVVSASAVIPVRVKEQDDRFILQRGGADFFIQGAVAPDRFAELRACGANAVRAPANRRMLDAAGAAGLVVMANLPVKAQRGGFDWDDDSAVAAQTARVLATVGELKEHPAVALWALGNELDWIPGDKPYNHRLWRRLDEMAQAIKRLDPDHPVLTVVGTSHYAEKVQEIARDAPHFDLLGVNTYGDIAEAARLTRTYWPKPYIIAEWGPTGHWEVKKTAWKAPLEQTSSEKAAVIADRYQNVILADRARCLGSFVFYWAEKQETTHTWYGLFCGGLRTESIDVMEHFWRGEWPQNRSPSIRELRFVGGADHPTLAPAARARVAVQAADPEGDPLVYRWEVRPEVEIPEHSYAGGLEKAAAPVAGRFLDPTRPDAEFHAPDRPGAYRVFLTINDGHGHMAYGNIPFRVTAP